MPPDRRSAAGAATDAVIALCRAVRKGGGGATIDSELALCRCLAEVDIRSRGQVYWACRACLTRRPDDIEAFDLLFERFWAGLSLERGPDPVAEHGESDPRMPGPQHGGESLPQFRFEGRAASLLDGGVARATQEIPVPAGSDGDDGRRGVLAAWSRDEALGDRRALDYAHDELTAVRRLAEELRRSAPERRSRRRSISARGGRLDIRRTLRRAMRSDGEAIRPAFSSQSRRPRRLLLICDVSGSMERYSRVLLGSLQASVAAGVKAEAFVFATRLTRLTGALSDRDVGRALERARASVPDWSGGTRIGSALAEFNRRYAPLGLARGAVAIVVSDGWDRGSPELLAREVSRLQLQARRLIWLNPRPADLDDQPLAAGMQAALPYVDDFVPGHDPRAVAGLASVICGLGAARPERRQRALHSVRS